MKFLILILAPAILFNCYDNAWAQAPAESSELVKELLAAPAPIPRGAETSSKTQTRLQKIFDENAKIPPDDAPLEDLVDFWKLRTNYGKFGPSDTVKQRLLDGCSDDLGVLADLLPLFDVGSVIS